MKTRYFFLFIAAIAFSAGLSLAADVQVHGKTEVPPAYPLKKCVISDEALGEHGKPVKVTSEGTDVYLCCDDCVTEFKKDPAKYVKLVKDAQPKK